MAANAALLALGEACPPALAHALQHMAFHQAVTIQAPLALSTSACSMHVCRLTTVGGGEQQQQEQLCVAKSYLKHRLEPAELQQVYREVHLHQQLQSEHVVPFWAAVDDGTQLHILSSYCPQGDLRGIMAEGGPLHEAAVRDQVVLPLLLALHDLHSRGLVHRDVKPDNVFVSGSSVLLGDFGLAVGLLADAPAEAPAATATAAKHSHSHPLARLARPHRRSSDSSSTNSGNPAPLSPNSSSSLASDTGERSHTSGGGGGLCRSLSLDSASKEGAPAAALLADSEHAGGTPAYCAPEVVRAAFNQMPLAEAVGPQNDVWSLGVLVLECLTGRHPFGDAAAPAGQVMAAISSSKCLQLAQLPVSEQCRDWLAAALARDPRQRWSVEQLLQHEWLAAAAPAAHHVGDATACRDRTCRRAEQLWGPCEHSTPSAVAAAVGRAPSFSDEAYRDRDSAWRAQDARAPSLLEQCGLAGITSWED